MVSRLPTAHRQSAVIFRKSNAVIELYHADMSTCAQKVRLVLALKKLPWESRLLDLRRRDQHRPDYLKLNPNGVVPTLVDDGQAIMESTIICEYLDDAYPDPPLRPAAPTERAGMRIWTRRLDETLHFSTGVGTEEIALGKPSAGFAPTRPASAGLSKAQPQRRGADAGR